MVAAVVHNIEDMINERAPSHIPTWNAVCIAATPLKAGSNMVYLLSISTVLTASPLSSHSLIIAETACHDWEKFCANGGGPIVVGAVQGASCFGPAYEFATIVVRDNRYFVIFTQCFLYIVSKWQSACACANNNTWTLTPKNDFSGKVKLSYQICLC
jgi:hypothetical protein